MQDNKKDFNISIIALIISLLTLGINIFLMLSR